MVDTLAKEPVPKSRHATSHRRPAAASQLNWQLLFGTLFAVVILAALGYWRYANRLDATVNSLLERAQSLAQEGNWRQALVPLNEYVERRPNEVEGWARLAEAMVEIGAVENGMAARAIEAYERAIGNARRSHPERLVPLVESLVELLTEAGDYGPAVRYAEQHLEPQDVARAQAVKALAEARTGDVIKRRRAFEQSRKVLQELLPGDFELAIQAAALARFKLEDDIAAGIDPATADALVNEAVEHPANRDNPWAFLRRGVYRMRFNLAGAVADLEKALDMATANKDDELRLAAAGRLLGMAQRNPQLRESLFARVVPILEELRETRPGDVRPQQGLAEVHFHRGEFKQAAQLLQASLAGEPSYDRRLRLLHMLAWAQISRGRYAEAQQSVNEMRGLTEEFAARSGMPKRDADTRSARAEMLQARIWIAQGQHDRAGKLAADWLRRVTPDSDDNRALYVEALKIQGAAQRINGEWPQAAQSFERVLEFEPNDEHAIAQAADAWKRAGQNDRSVRLFKETSQLSDVQNINFADALLRQEMSRPADQRNWHDFESSLRRIEGRDPEHWAIKLLSARRARHESDIDAAKRFLDAIEGKLTDSQAKEAWPLVALEYEQLGLRAEADRALEHLSKISPLDGLLLKARVATFRGDHQRAIDLLAGAELPEDGKFTLLDRERIRAYTAAGDYRQAIDAAARLRTKNPADESLVHTLIELHMQSGQLKEAGRLIKELRQEEGESGVRWRYYQARYDLQTSSRIEHIRKLQEQIERLEPRWSPGFALKGDLFQALGRAEDAINAYERAIELGSSNITVFEQLIKLLSAQGRLVDADKYLQRLSALIPTGEVSERLAGMSVLVPASLNNIGEALRRANERAKQRPDDPQSLVWFGQMLAISGKDDAAEKVLSRATEIASEDHRTWNAMFAFYASRDVEKAAQTLENLLTHASAELSQKNSMVARGYELLGRWNEALAYYRKVLESDPTDHSTRLRLATVLSQIDTSAAVTELRTVITSADPSLRQSAQQMLATIRAQEGTDSAWDEVSQLLDAGGLDQDSDAKTQSLIQGRLLARYGGAKRRAAAKESLRRAVENGSASAVDRLWLAVLFEQDGDFETAKEQYLQAIREASDHPVALSSYIRFLLRTEDLTTAARELEKLAAQTEQGNPLDRIRYATLKSALLRRQGREAEIADFAARVIQEVEPLLLTPHSRMLAYGGIGRLYESVTMYEQAETWLRKLTEVAPNDYALLAKNLCRQGKHREAVDLALGYLSSQPAKLQLRVLVELLAIGSPDESAIELVLETVDQAISEDPSDADVYTLAGVLSVQQSDYETALERFEKALAIDPNNVVALNNAATLMTEVAGREADALPTVERAISIAGENPILLDTKGIVLIKLERAAEAVEALNRAVASMTDARFYLHLAVAHQKLGALDEARDALVNADFYGLQEGILTKSDEIWLADLRREIGALETDDT